MRRYDPKMHGAPEKLAAYLMGTSVAFGGGWITTVETSSRLHIPVWPVWVFGALFVIGAVSFGVARGIHLLRQRRGISPGVWWV
jgi:hypothetical protein